MRNCRKSLYIMLICVVVSALCPIQILAQGSVDPARDCSLTVNYRFSGEQVINGAVCSVYRLADVDSYLNFTLTDQFKKYDNVINLSGNTAGDWNNIANALKGYVQLDKLMPLYKLTTKDNGSFTINHMESGLYLIIGEKYKIGRYTYTPSPAIVSLPSKNPSSESSEWIYDLEASLKVSRSYVRPDRPSKPEPDTVMRKVLKVWDDKGYENKRPSEITVQLLRDGELFDTVRLNEENDWSYTWDKLEESDSDGMKYEWSVVESLNDNYIVEVVQSGVTYVFTNTYKVPDLPDIPDDPDEPDNPPVDNPPSDNPPGGDVPHGGNSNGNVPPNNTHNGGNPTGNVPGAAAHGRLPQTGMLWWPVPVLLCLGAVFVTFGIIRSRRDER